MTEIEGTASTGAVTAGRHPQRMSDSRENAAHAVEDAFGQTASAHQSGTAAAQVRAREQLQDAVEDVREAGVGWERIGDILGIARGNAYHRHRKRPTSRP